MIVIDTLTGLVDNMDGGVFWTQNVNGYLRELRQAAKTHGIAIVITTHGNDISNVSKARGRLITCSSILDKIVAHVFIFSCETVVVPLRDNEKSALTKIHFPFRSPMKLLSLCGATNAHRISTPAQLTVEAGKDKGESSRDA